MDVESWNSKRMKEKFRYFCFHGRILRIPTFLSVHLSKLSKLSDLFQLSISMDRTLLGLTLERTLEESLVCIAVFHVSFSFKMTFNF